MKSKLTKYGLMTMAAVLLVAMAFAGAASAEIINIKDATEWQSNVSNGHFASLGTGDVINLTGDIDFGGTGEDVAIVSWTNDSSPNIEGNGHTISNFNISSGMSIFGLFEDYYGTRIANLTLSNFSVSGSYYVGSLVGYANSEIHIENVHVMCGNVSGGGSVGGLVGYADFASWINASSAERMYVQLGSGSLNLGGLVGYAGSASHINDSWVSVSEIDASGSEYVGGLVGRANSASCFMNASAMDCKISGSNSVGGLVGCADSASEYDASRVENCTIAGSDYVGGLVGYADVASSFTGVQSWVNYTWVNASSTDKGSIMGSGSASVTIAPLHTMVYSSTLDNSTILGIDNSFDGFSPSIAIGSIIVRDNLQPGVDYGYGSAKHVTYVANGATSGSAPAKQAYALGSTVTVAGQGDLAKTGYVFDGWNTAAGGTGTSYAPGATFTITKDTMLYANWTEKPATYVEVNTWAGLNKSVSEWAETEEARTVAVNTSILTRGTTENQEGINVSGTIILTTTASLVTGNEAVIDGNGLGRLFEVNGGNLTLCGNGTVTLNLTGGNASVCSDDHSGGAINASSGNLTVNDGVKITNCSADFGGAVYVNSGYTFTMNGGSITDCSASDSGGSVYIDGTFTMNNGSIADCTASYGGSVYIDGTFTMNNGSIADCTAKSGGSVLNYNGEFIMNNGSIASCTAEYGGGVYNCDAFTMNNGSIADCTAVLEDNYSYGGGVYNDGTFTMTNGTIVNCTAVSKNQHSCGGGVYNNVSFAMTGGSISDCTAVSEGNFSCGGGVYNCDAFTMTNGSIVNCTAVSKNHYSYGGGVYTYGAFTMNNGSIANCTAVSENETKYGGGGGVYVEKPATFTMNGGSISACDARYGGGVENSGTVELFDGSIKDNRASSCGAGVDNYKGIFNISKTVEIDENNDVVVYKISDIVYNINVVSPFTGSIGNITLYDYDSKDKSLSGFVGKVIVRNGTSVKDNVTLSTASVYSGYELTASGDDLIFSKKLTYTPSSPSKQTGSTQILQEGQAVPTPYATATPTAAPTAKPTEKPATPTVVSTAKPTTQPTQSSPAPFVGILAGLGAAALVLTRMRK